MKKIGVILSGCGVYDGSEIHEAVLTLLALAQSGAEAVCFAPDEDQSDVINHLNGDVVVNESRHVLTEAARICRGQIKPLRDASATELDGLIVPGGFGAAKNLSTFAQEGGDCTVNPDLYRLVRDCHAQKKPLGFMCIAPVMLPKILPVPVRITIGTDLDTAELLEDMGAEHVPCPVDDIVVDEEQKVVTTPAYMLAKSIDEAALGINKLVRHVLSLTE